MDNQVYDTEYAKGFNEGYILAKHLPELADQLSKVKDSADRLQGLKDGCLEFVLETERRKLSEKSISNLDKEAAKDQDIDKD